MKSFLLSSTEAPRAVISPPRKFIARLMPIILFVREKPLGAAGGIVVIAMLLIALLAPVLSPMDPLETSPLDRMLPPSSEHLLGTDGVGRDVLSRMIYGARVSLQIGVLATLLGTIAGALIGIISGYKGGRIDFLVQRLMDVLLAFPALILGLMIMAVLGPSIPNVIAAIAIPFTPRANRIARSVTLATKEAVFIQAARGLGLPEMRIIIRHLTPNCVPPFIVLSTALLSSAVLVEASLSFLGLGVPPPHPSWGRSLSESMAYMQRSPWLAIWPGIAISLFVFGANLFGDALRDRLDPRLKRL
jgi:peptide/nickel transport system permease protein